MQFHCPMEWIDGGSSRKLQQEFAGRGARVRHGLLVAVFFATACAPPPRAVPTYEPEDSGIELIFEECDLSVLDHYADLLASETMVHWEKQFPRPKDARVKLVLRVDSDGNLLEARVVEQSNASAGRKALAAANLAAPYPPPPPDPACAIGGSPLHLWLHLRALAY